MEYRTGVGICLFAVIAAGMLAGVASAEGEDPSVNVELRSEMYRIPDGMGYGVPFRVDVELDGRPETSYDIRIQASSSEGGNFPATQTWDGSEWWYSRHYLQNAITTDERGRGSGAFYLRFCARYSDYSRIDNTAVIEVKIRSGDAVLHTFSMNAAICEKTPGRFCSLNRINVGVNVFTSSLEMISAVKDEINTSEEMILVYNHLSNKIYESLNEAASRGVDVRLLLSGGGCDTELSDPALDCIDVPSNLLDSYATGAYAVIDDTAFINIPERNDTRFYGLSAKDERTVVTYIGMFESVWSLFAPVEGVRGEIGNINPVEEESKQATDMVSFINSAEGSVLAEIERAPTMWDTHGRFEPNPYTSSLLSIARNNRTVKLLLDSSPENYFVNSETAEYINGVASAEELDIEARLVNRRAHDISGISGSTVVVDSESAAFSSVDWSKPDSAYPGYLTAGMIVEMPEVARTTTDMFSDDWKVDTVSPRARARWNGQMIAGKPVLFDATDSWDDTGIVSCEWDFDGDGNTDGTSPEREYTYHEPGIYRVSLTVRDADGNSDTTEIVVEVFDATDRSNVPRDDMAHEMMHTVEDSRPVLLKSALATAPFILLGIIVYAGRRKEKNEKKE